TLLRRAHTQRPHDRDPGQGSNKRYCEQPTGDDSERWRDEYRRVLSAQVRGVGV
ncbi:hypothetical protein AAVH_34686, partial [Aphelenchoides avenae]